jgi:O-methyltransferase
VPADSDSLRPGKAQAGKRAAGALVRGAVRRLGYDVVRTPSPAPPSAYPPDFDAETVATIDAVRPYTLTSVERIAALCEAIRYLERAGIPGDVVECGVWRGGSMMAAARTLVGLGRTQRDLYLYDTFSVFPRPGERDVDVWGNSVAERLDADLQNPAYDYLPEEQVERLVRSTGYPADRIHSVRGLVEDTIPAVAPATIALLRLDTDLYASTAHEMEHLFPRISPGGVLIVDDYGEFLGAKAAIDEYLKEHDVVLLLSRIDHTGRLAVVPPR